MNTQEKINDLQKQLDSLKAELNKPTEFSRGWCMIETDNKYNWMLFNPYTNERGQLKYEYGFEYIPFNFFKDKETGYIGYSKDITKNRPATPEEIKKALINYCESLGIKEGVIINKSEISHYKYPVEIRNNNFEYDEIKDSLTIDGHNVYKQGKFATVVKDEVIKIGGYEVKRNGLIYIIGCKHIHKNEVERIKKFMESNNFTEIAFDGIETDLKTINKILDKQ